MKIAISSDNHLDVNRQDPDEIVSLQANYLNEQNVEYYLFAGDMFNDFQKTKDYFEKLNTLITGKAYFIAGNHDMLKNITFAELENNNISDFYLHNTYIDIPNTDWRIIGNNGWYDYSFSPTLTEDEIKRWKNTYWIDAGIKQPMSDNEREQLVLQQSRQQFELAKQAKKKVIFVTHFVPNSKALWSKPATLKSDKEIRIFKMVNALLGSQHLGELIQDYPEIKYVFYGHVHGWHEPFQIAGATYLNQAVGVRKKKRKYHEWQKDTFMDQWKYRMNIINV
ncbi:metallophosphoesterase [Ligilactobacillus salivarius]|uniref:Metallophosphoesterase n=1 Tax=Ligilactobacillus salivarius TaxID=1624 RepID=A0ABD7YWX4_9LACO|nr:metallophosphoesterase [Ligilactobacillus salivarius]WHS06696.1 metallophosphoesterase [Ligilactobacillus salivarius]WHS08898.1 metallophosphoesterase [Ligilactobacillus salivarius]WHS10660.1 metallophosphoesterase [Ligilactobacillus salivarius]WHS14599.1 metallophosphoesterase [Ligilactobacillus salivarius]WHS18501.1 metallophosphoesterase [Ligilactobacillus salivarius]